MIAVRQSTVSTSLVVVMLVSCDTMPVRAYEHETTESLKDVPDATWVLVEKGGVTAPLDIMAYSGGWYDSEAHQFCLFGGGHYNYSGNEVWCFDIASLAWNERYPPDVVTRPPYDGGDQGAYNNFDNKKYPGALFNPANEPIEQARPMSRHTYDQLEFIDGVGAVLWGGYTWGDSQVPWCSECKDSWVFDSANNAWKYLFNGRNPSPNVTAGVGASAYANHDGKLYAKVLQDTWTYDPAGNQWSKIRTRNTPPWSIEGTLEYDPNHRNLYFFGGNYDENLTLWKFDIEKRSWVIVKAKGPAPDGGAHNGPGVAYDTKNDVLVIYYGGTVWIYNPLSNSWEKVRPKHHPSESDYVFGRFRYDPVNNGFWLHAAEETQHATWFFRYRN